MTNQAIDLTDTTRFWVIECASDESYLPLLDSSTVKTIVELARRFPRLSVIDFPAEASYFELPRVVITDKPVTLDEVREAYDRFENLDDNEQFELTGDSVVASDWTDLD
jgi:hypothetical protein